MVKTAVMFKCGGHTFMLTYPKGQPEGADEALASWRDNPHVPLYINGHDELLRRLTWMANMQTLFGMSGGLY